MKKTKLAIFFLSIIMVIIIWYSLYAKNILYEWTVYFGSYLENSELGIVMFILLAALSAMLSPFSSVPIAPIAIVIWGPLLTSAMLVAGWTIGGILSYLIGKKFGYGIASRFIAHDKIDKWSRQIQRKVSIFLVLAFRVMTPSETGYIFGIFKYPFWKYLLVTFFSELPFALAISYAGSAIIEREREIFLLFAAASLIFILVFYRIYRKEFKKVVKS